MKLEVGMYCYNKTNRQLGIGEIINFQRNNNVNIRYKNDIELVSIGNVIASNKVIDLIEVGDYVNGEKVIRVIPQDICGDEVLDYQHIFVNDKEVFKDDIKSIVTKEMFANAEYKVETN